MQHLNRSVFPDHDVAPKECLKRSHVVRDEAPTKRALAHRHAACESRADPDDDALFARETSELSNRGGIGHWMAVARYQHARSEGDPIRSLRRSAKLHPDVGVEGRRVVE